MKKTYHGSCHCGAVRFECDLDLVAAVQFEDGRHDRWESSPLETRHP